MSLGALIHARDKQPLVTYQHETQSDESPNRHQHGSRNGQFSFRKQGLDVVKVELFRFRTGGRALLADLAIRVDHVCENIASFQVCQSDG